MLILLLITLKLSLECIWSATDMQQMTNIWLILLNECLGPFRKIFTSYIRSSKYFIYLRHKSPSTIKKMISYPWISDDYCSTCILSEHSSFSEIFGCFYSDTQWSVPLPLQEYPPNKFDRNSISGINRWPWQHHGTQYAVTSTLLGISKFPVLPFYKAGNVTMKIVPYESISPISIFLHDSLYKLLNKLLDTITCQALV